jgi:hypothetical protein
MFLTADDLTACGGGFRRLDGRAFIRGHRHKGSLVISAG